MSDLREQLGVATCCGRCAATAAEYLPSGRLGARAPAAALGAVVVEAANDATVVAPMVEEVVRRA